MGQAMSATRNTPPPERMDSLTVRVAHRTDPGCVRTVNEDSYLVFEPQDPLMQAARGRLFVVADGMGGSAGGDKASRMVVKATREAFYDEDEDLKVSEALVRSVQHANRSIFEYARLNEACRGMGSTCSAVVLHGRHAHFGHVGDSRVYLVRDHRILQLTDDHSRVAQMIRDGELSPEEATSHPERNVVMRWLGLNPQVTVDVPPHPLELKAGDRMLMCSDGLTSHVSDVELLRQIDQRDPRQAVDRLVELARSRGGSDNITAIIIHVVQVISPSARRYRAPMVGDGSAALQLMQPVTKAQLIAQRQRWLQGALIAGMLWALLLTAWVVVDSFSGPSTAPRVTSPILDDEGASSDASGRQGDSAAGQRGRQADAPPSLARVAGSALDDPDKQEASAGRRSDAAGTAASKEKASAEEASAGGDRDDSLNAVADPGRGESDDKGDGGEIRVEDLLADNDAGDVLDPKPEVLLKGNGLQKALSRMKNPRGPVCMALRKKIAEELNLPVDDLEAFVQGVARYQRSQGISPVGHPGPQTRAKIFGKDIRREVCARGGAR